MSRPPARRNEDEAEREARLDARRERDGARRAEAAGPDGLVPRYSAFPRSAIEWRDDKGRFYVRIRGSEGLRAYVLLKVAGGGSGRTGAKGAEDDDNDDDGEDEPLQFPEPQERVQLYRACDTAPRTLVPGSGAADRIFGRQATSGGASVDASVEAVVESVEWEEGRVVGIVTWEGAPFSGARIGGNGAR